MAIACNVTTAGFMVADLFFCIFGTQFLSCALLSWGVYAFKRNSLLSMRAQSGNQQLYIRDGRHRFSHDKSYIY